MGIAREVLKRVKMKRKVKHKRSNMSEKTRNPNVIRDNRVKNNLSINDAIGCHR